MQRIFSAALLIVFPLLLFGQPRSASSTLIFVSDTQAPMWFERVYLKYDDNEKATQKILFAILQESNVAGVIHAGDVTAHASTDNAWMPMVPFLDSLRARSIPLMAARGNHDYMFFSGAAIKNFQRYLPGNATEYSARKFGPVEVIVLNSNFSHMDDSAVTRQNAWYRSALNDCDADSSVHFIVTVDHHPPITNSSMVSASEEVRHNFLPPFFEAKKSVLFLTGHAHRFEHFREKGKDFLVVGGGGGLLHSKRAKNISPDLDTGADEGRFFHYVRCSITPDSLTFEVLKVTADSFRPEVVHRFTLAAPLTPSR